MEKINIVDLLKDCPRGMKLYSPIFGEVYLDKIRPHLAIVVTTDKAQGDIKEEFLYDGRYGMKGECMLFPSKDKTTWEGFHRPFKDGDIVALDTEKGVQVFIFEEYIKGEKDYAHCYVMLDDDGRVDIGYGDYYVERFATEEEKQKLFKAIKDNGYKWNTKTKTLEKLTKPATHKILSDALATFGAEHQRMMCMEECAEFIDVLAKYDRGRADAKDVITELADVSIMAEQMAMLFGKEELEAEKERKLKRLLERINEKS